MVGSCDSERRVGEGRLEDDDGFDILPEDRCECRFDRRYVHRKPWRTYDVEIRRSEIVEGVLSALLGERDVERRPGDRYDTHPHDANPS